MADLVYAPMSDVAMAYSDVGYVQPPWTPKDIGASLVALYEASDIAHSSGNVSKWADSSGNGYDLTPPSTPPTYSANAGGGLPGVILGGDPQTLTNGTVVHVQSAFFVVSGVSGDIGNNCLSGAGHIYLGLNGNASQLSMYTGTLGPYSGQVISARSTAGMVQRAGNDVDFYLAGVKVNKTGGARIYDDFSIALCSLGGSQYATATLQFVALFNAAISDSDAAKLIAYLQQKYLVA